MLSLRRLLVVTGHRPRCADFLRPLACLPLAAVPAMLLPCGALAALPAIILRGTYFLVLLCAFSYLTEALLVRDRRWLRRVFGVDKAQDLR